MASHSSASISDGWSLFNTSGRRRDTNSGNDSRRAHNHDKDKDKNKSVDILQNNAQPLNYDDELINSESVFDLFPSLELGEKSTGIEDDKFIDGTQNSSFYVINNRDSQKNNTSNLESDFIDENLCFDETSSDIRTSILHRIVDNESFSEDFNHDKTFYTKMYNKYDPNVHVLEEKDITDFQIYNNSLMKEEKIKRKLDKIAKRKGKFTNDPYTSNILTPMNEEDLGDVFLEAKNPKEWIELEDNIKNKQYFRKNKRRSIFKKRLHFGSSPESEPEITEKYDGIFCSEVETSSSTIPIDDDIGIDDLPIDSQPFRKIKRMHKVTDDIFPHGIDMIVSNQEKVDYNFRRIDQYEEIDPNSNPTFGEKTKGKIFKLLDVINPMRTVRIQRANKYQIQRKLNVRHLHQIALGGTLGVGLLLSSGKAFSIAGPLGCLLGFIISGLVVLATMLSFCEIMTLIPLCGGVSGISSRFVDDAFGFALGVGYWVTYAIGLPTEITAASIMLSFYPNLKIPGPSTAGWIALFFAATLLINLCDIRVYGEFEYYSTIIKLLILLGLMIYMVVLNCGGSGPFHKKIGFKYWDAGQSDLANNITFGLFRPTFDVDDKGLGALDGIGGSEGRFLQVVIAAVVAAYAYVGTEIVIIAGSESRNPRQAIPSATQNIYWRIIIFYLVAIFIVGLNVYSGDPRLLRYYDGTRVVNNLSKLQDQIIERIGGKYCESLSLNWAGFGNGNQSPFVIAIQSAGLCSFAAAVNAFLLYFAVTAATSQLYASSRTLYFMAIQNKAPSIFAVCTKRGVPYMSVLFTAAFGCLAFLSVNNDTAMVFERLVSVCATSGLLVWSGMCLSFIRFYHGLKLRPDIISRDDENYPYRSPFQPYLAYFGMITAFLLVLASGFVVFLRDEWSPLFFVSSYGSLFLFIFCYVVFKIFRRTKVHRLDQLDLDSGRREIDRIIWEDEKNYASNFKEMVTKGINLLL